MTKEKVAQNQRQYKINIQNAKRVYDKFIN